LATSILPINPDFINGPDPADSSLSGRGEVYLDCRDSLFVFNGGYDDRSIPKDAGLIWNRLRRKRWATADPVVAARLIDFARPDCQHTIRKRLQEIEQTKAASSATYADIHIPAPEGLDYLPFQRAGIAFAASRKSTLIADEPGLGKTIQAIGVINYDPTIKKVLVIAPASVKINWLREIERWSVRNLTVGIAGPRNFPDTDIVVINYELLNKYAQRGALDRDWDLIIVDEAHYLKNPNAQRTKLVKALVRYARKLIFLTGTPMLNRPVELFPILNMLDPARWNNFLAFGKRYADGYQNNFGWDFSGASNLRELQDKLRGTVMIRRLKSDVLTELPAKRRQIIELPSTGASKLIAAELNQYNRIDEFRKAVEALKEGQRTDFSATSRLRQEIALKKLPSVVDYVRNLVDNDPSYKVVIFAHHQEVIEKIAEEFGNKAVTFYGNNSPPERQESIDRFQNDPSVQVFIGSIQAEFDWTPGRMEQAEDRVHRIGQINPVLIQFFVLEGSLDASMAKTLVEKEQVIRAGLDISTEAA
jgi:SWI/SNF-related matrix-associated actin-dependent regulator 1 of chromatin subfamily A